MTKQGEESFFTYDVFLSFRGEDTRHKFIGHLHKELIRKGINTFIDDEGLKTGEDISPGLSKAIEDSKICIIVMSENYATSTFCLDELVKILGCVKSNGKQLAFPIFYHVDPSNVRKQKNSYEKAMIEHENRFGKDSEKVVAWRSALSEVANLKGQHITDGYEDIHIDNIVKEVYANLAPKPLLYNDEDPVGLEERIDEVKLLLEMKPNDDAVSMLGIYGLGGIGKTEIAKALYNRIVHQFEAASFLEDVGEKLNKINGMEDLQRKLLSEMKEELETELGSTSKGMSEIKRRLHRKKVLLVLDDVVDIDNIKQLAGASDWFGPGSRILITTRDKKLLDYHQVEKIYKMHELNDQHSLELFCRNAFKQSHPETGYEALSSRAVGYVKGLPLALKVIGSNLATERSLDAWISMLEEYERVLDRKIQGVLEVSYHRLGGNAKRVFLDIACFFKWRRIEYVENILEEYGAKTNINVLINKSLLKVEDGYLKMHDLIQDMGRAIVMHEAPNPGKRSRLWVYEDVIEVLNGDSGSDAIEGIMLDPPQREKVDWSGYSFEKMKWLRILIVRNTFFTIEPKHLSNHLRLLDWEEYPSKSFPPQFHPKRIIFFHLPKSNLTFEKPLKTFSRLVYMNFSHNHSIVKMPDVFEVQNLRRLVLDVCGNLTGIHESVGFLKYLTHLSISQCSKLQNFPRKMFLPSLQVLDLNGCFRLEHFPDITEKMETPLKIYMKTTSIKELPDSIGNLTGLVSMDMGGCTNLSYLPSSLFMLPNVESFEIDGCPKLGGSFKKFVETPSTACGNPKFKILKFQNAGLSDEDLQGILNCYPQLEELIAPGNDFVSLPTCINESIHLTRLDVSDCKKLQRIPKCISLQSINVDHCENLEDISELPSTIQKIDARYCYSLSVETSIILWSQVLEERSGLEMVMPATEIPEWFDLIGEGGNPRFWASRKFPVIALAMIFHEVNETVTKYRQELVELNVVINGQCVPRKGGLYDFRIGSDHALICDLRNLFSNEEWLGLDAFLKHDWNQVEVTFKTASSTSRLSSWGIFVYREGISTSSSNKMEDEVQFTCPDPKYSFIAPTRRHRRRVHLFLA